MRKIVAILAGILVTASVFAQSPNKMPYQAVIRNANDKLVTSQLEVIGSEGQSLTYGYLDSDGSTGTTTSRTNPYSIYADNYIAAAEFNAHSDVRIKSTKGLSDASTDLNTLMKIEITDYTLKDEVVKGNSPNKKVIAQQLKEVYPQAVKDNITKVVPLELDSFKGKNEVLKPNTKKKFKL